MPTWLGLLYHTLRSTPKHCVRDPCRLAKNCLLPWPLHRQQDPSVDWFSVLLHLMSTSALPTYNLLGTGLARCCKEQEMKISCSISNLQSCDVAFLHNKQAIIKVWDSSLLVCLHGQIIFLLPDFQRGERLTYSVVIKCTEIWKAIWSILEIQRFQILKYKNENLDYKKYRVIIQGKIATRKIVKSYFWLGLESTDCVQKQHNSFTPIHVMYCMPPWQMQLPRGFILHNFPGKFRNHVPWILNYHTDCIFDKT